VADGRPELQLHAFAVGIIWIDYVRPVKAAWPKTRVSGGARGNGVSFDPDKGPAAGADADGATPTPPTSKSRFPTASVQASAPSRNSGFPESADSAQPSMALICSTFSESARLLCSIRLPSPARCSTSKNLKVVTFLF